MNNWGFFIVLFLIYLIFKFFTLIIIQESREKGKNNSESKQINKECYKHNTYNTRLIQLFNVGHLSVFFNEREKEERSKRYQNKYLFLKKELSGEKVDLSF